MGDAQLGVAGPTRNRPVDVANIGGTVNQISADLFTTCVVTAAGAAGCWGGGADVSGIGASVLQIAAGAAQSCALTTHSRVRCWAGDSMSRQARPRDVPGLSGVALLAEIRNQAPRATAGGSYIGNRHAPIAMSGAAAFDANLADTLTYSWSVDSGACRFSDPTSLRPALTCADPGVFAVTLIVSDGNNPATYSADAAVTIRDAFVTIGANLHAGRTSDPDFAWLSPGLAGSFAPTGPFDGDALDSLTLEVCQLDAARKCIAEPPLATLTGNSGPAVGRIRINRADEAYSVEWFAAAGRVRLDVLYRVTVFRDHEELGAMDLKFVPSRGEWNDLRLRTRSRDQRLYPHRDDC